MADEYKIPISTPGADKAERTLRKLASAEQRVGHEAEDAGRKSARGSRDAADALDRHANRVAMLNQAYAALRQGAVHALRIMSQEIEKVDETSSRTLEGLRSVMALSMVAGERAETRQFLERAAVGAGMPMERVAPAYYTLLGGTAGMDRSRQEGLFGQALAMAQTDPSAGLDPLVNLMTTIASQQPHLSPQQIGNLASVTIEQAKSTPGEMAQYLPPILSTAQAGGVGAADAAAMFSFATRRGGGVATSGTAVRSAMLGLLAPPQETAKQMAAHGFPAGGSLMDRIGWLARHGSDLPPELQAALGGRRGIEAVVGIAASPDEFRRELAATREGMTAPGSRLAERLESMYGEDAGQRALLQLQQGRVAADVGLASDDAAQDQAIAAAMEAARVRLGQGGAERWLNRQTERLLRTFGGRPEALADPHERTVAELIRMGYSTQDVLDIALPAMQAGGEVGGSFDPTVSRGAGRTAALEALEAAGKRPLGVTQIHGGTHYHSYDRTDPAGKPRQPAGRY